MSLSNVIKIAAGLLVATVATVKVTSSYLQYKEAKATTLILKAENDALEKELNDKLLRSAALHEEQRQQWQANLERNTSRAKAIAVQQALWLKEWDAAKAVGDTARMLDLTDKLI